MSKPNELNDGGDQKAHTVVGIENQIKHISERSLVEDSQATVKRFSPLWRQVSETIRFNSMNVNRYLICGSFKYFFL